MKCTNRPARFRWPALGAVLVLTVGCAAPATPAASAPTTATIPTASIPTASIPTASIPTAASAQGSAPVLSSAVPAPPSAEASTAAALPDCTAGSLTTRDAGYLTLATAEPLEAPWFVGDDPASSDGYESQVARTVATTLGFGPQQQKWVVVEKTGALSGDAAGFDVFVDQVTAADAADGQVDLSSGYYAITEAVVMPAAAAAALGGGDPDLAALRIGVTGPDTGQTALQDRGATQTRPFASSGEVLTALSTADIDAAVLPTPDALRAAAADDGVTVVGQLPTGRWQPEQFHLALARDSALTPCVSAAVDRMRIEGTLDQLTQQWITGPLAPELG